MRTRTQYETDETTFSARAYKVKGHGGVAWRVRGWEVENVYEEYEDECVFCIGSGERKGEICEHCNGDGKMWMQDEESTARRTGKVVCVMVGDDHKWTFEPEDITPLEREEYCGECGQIGCAHDGLDRSEEE